jgi:hypothetical protein
MSLSCIQRFRAGVVCLSLAAVGTAMAQDHQHLDLAVISERRKAAHLRQRDGRDLPTVVVTGSPLPPPTASVKARSRHFSSPRGIPLPSLLLPDIPEVSIPIHIERFGGPPPSLPIQDSDAVVRGVVIAARASLTEDETAVYSEFDVRVDEAFKGAASAPLGGTVTVLRLGGVVQLPHVRIRVRDADQTMPLVGGTYVLFLRKHSPDDLGFIIVTGYRVDDTLVQALDLFPHALSFETRTPAELIAAVRGALP